MSRANVSLGLTAVNQTARAFRGARNEIRQTRRAVSGMSGMMMSNRRAVQQAGMQLSDFAVQVGAGQSAILAFTQNVPQFVQGFGAVGGVLAAMITIGGTMALVMTKAGKSLADLTPIAGVVETELKGVVEAFRTVIDATIDFANILVNNLDRVLITASLVAGFFTTKWIAGMIGASVAARGLGGSVLFLAGTLVTLAKRLLFVGVFVALGEVIFRVIELSRHLGGLGAVFVMVRDVAIDVWARIKEGAGLLLTKLQIVGKRIAQWWGGLIMDMQSMWAEFLGTLVEGAHRGALDIIAPGAFEGLENMARSASDTVMLLREDFKMLDIEIADLEKTLETASETFRRPIKSLEELKQAMRDAHRAGQDIDIRDWFGGGDGDGEGGDKLKKRLKSYKEMTEDLASSISKSMGDAFMSMVDGTKSVGDAFKDMARAVIKELYDVLVVQRLVGAVGGFLGGSTIGSGGGVIGGVLKSTFGGARANGGPVSPGKAYLVGERGPELLIPGRTGTVVPNGAGGGGGPTFVMNYTFTGGVTERDLQQASKATVEASKAAVLDAFQRGGAYGRGMQR